MGESPAVLAALIVLCTPAMVAFPAALAAEGSPATADHPAAAALDRAHADHWIARCASADHVALDAAGVAALNRRLLDSDRSMRDLAALPEELPAQTVRETVATLAKLPDMKLAFDGGGPVGPADLDRWLAAVDLDGIPARVTPRFAVVTRRAALRRFPTRERIHRADGPADIDRLQESAFFPGTPVAAVHATPAGDWTFVLGTNYAAWIETGALAFAPRDAVLDVARRSTRIVVAPRATAVPPGGGEGVVLDMATALPAEGDAASVVALPVRTADGGLSLAAARVDPADALRDGPLPASRRNLLAQAFRFLGERYGWGHDGGTRDCSGFVGDVYKSLGILLPRNTGDQAASPAFARTVVEPGWDHARRRAALDALLPGDLVFVPGHVMMIVGHDEEGPWVIHDTHDGRVAGDPQPANGVVVAPLERMRPAEGGGMIDRITTLVRVLPTPAAGP
ncbi:MAG: NlpC/P60 family protein [Planctomycetaceae bacterium]